MTGGVLVGGTGTEGVAASHDEGARGAAEWRGVGMGVAGAALGQAIEIGSLKLVGTVAGEAIDAEIIGEDKEDVGLAQGRGRLAGAEEA